MAQQNPPPNPPPEEQPPPRKKRMKPPKDAKVDMTPMIDVVFLLIIFFMLVTEMVKMEIETITLPFALSAKEEEEKSKEKRIVVNLTEKGTIKWMHAKKTPEEFLTILRAAAQRCPRDPDNLPIMSVKVRADAKCEYKYVQDVMAQCMKAFVWKLSFGVSPVDNEEMLMYRVGN